MNPNQKKLYDDILARLAQRGVTLAQALTRLAPKNKHEWLLRFGGIEPRNDLFLWPRTPLIPTEILRKLVRSIDVLEDDKQCWIFNGYTNPYGQMYVCRSTNRAHVIVNHLWDGLPEEYGGKRPGYLTVMHSCDNPPCCNPNHLSIGTCSENIKQSFLKNRKKGFPKGANFMPSPGRTKQNRVY